MQFERGEGEAAFDNRRAECGLQRPRLFLGHLVLDGDVRARIVEVLIGEIAVEVIGDPAAQGEQLRTFKRNRSPLAEVEQAGDARLRRREFARDLRQIAG